MTHTSTEQPDALPTWRELAVMLSQGHYSMREAVDEIRRQWQEIDHLHYRIRKLEASQARVPLSDSALLARIRKEIDRAIINDHKTEPAFGKRTGEPCVKIAHLEATIAGWEVDCGITQEKQG